MADNGGEWQQARRRKGAARREKSYQTDHRDFGNVEDKCRIEKKITEAAAELRGEGFWLDWKEVLSGSLAVSEVEVPLKSGSSFSDRGLDCVCYGLGSFSSCISSRYQLAMLVLLLDALKISPGRCSVFDPIFTPGDRDILQALGFTVLTENEEGKRAVSRPTLFYLIHCGKALYNNLLWRNWSPQSLAQLTIVGNSFRSMQERMLQRELQRDYSFIHDVICACEEIALPCSPRFLDVFNDTVVLGFPSQRLACLPPHTWTQPPEPLYLQCEDLEIIQRDQDPRNPVPAL